MTFYLFACALLFSYFFFSSRRRHTRCLSDWSSDVCSSDLYAMSAFGDAVVMGQVDDGATVNFIMLASSYQHAYGNLYTTPNDILEPKYASEIGRASCRERV